MHYISNVFATGTNFNGNIHNDLHNDISIYIIWKYHYIFPLFITDKTNN